VELESCTAFIDVVGMVIEEVGCAKETELATGTAAMVEGRTPERGAW